MLISSEERVILVYYVFSTLTQLRKKLCSKPITFFCIKSRGENGKVEPLLADQIELLENADGVITKYYIEWIYIY